MCTSKNQVLSTDDPSKSESNLSLEDFPAMILDQIFELVQSPDLVKIAPLSRTLYWPAVNRIYKNITLYQTYSWYDENERCYDLRDKSEWPVNHGTVLKLQKIEKLNKTLQNNRQLAQLIKKVTFQCTIAYKPVTRFLKFIPNLKSFHDDAGCLRTKKISKNLESVTCSVHHTPNFSRHLVELKLIDFFGNDDSFIYLARRMIASKSYTNLRKLQFANFDYTTHSETYFDPPEPTYTAPNWTGFIDEFVTQGVRLNLNALGLCGDLSDIKVTVSEQLKKSIDLENLITLRLDHEDYTDVAIPEVTFTELITKFTPNIENLELYPIDGENETILQAFVNTLTLNLPNQLKSLSFSYVPDPEMEEHERTLIQDAIISSQVNLVKLKIENGLWFTPGERLLRDLEECFDWMTDMMLPWILETERTKLFPEILDTPHRIPYISPIRKDPIYDLIGRVHKLLKKDQIYTTAAKNMPFLSQYYCGRMFVDVKRGGLIVNGKTIPFDDYSAKDFYSDASDESWQTYSDESDESWETQSETFEDFFDELSIID